MTEGTIGACDGKPWHPSPGGFTHTPTDERPWAFQRRTVSKWWRSRAGRPAMYSAAFCLWALRPWRWRSALLAIRHPPVPGKPKYPGIHVIEITRGKARPKELVWNWDGDVDAPTVRPSIRCKITGFHGYLTKGKWEVLSG